MPVRICSALFALMLYGQTAPAPKNEVTPDPSGKFLDSADKIWKLRGNGVCLYSGTKFQGDAECVKAGTTRTLSEFAYRSVRFFGKAKRLEVIAPQQDDPRAKPELLP